MLGLLENNFVTLHGARIATIIEVALLSLSLADRYNLFRKEKEIAQRKLIEMQREANRVLEQKVADRTKELNKANLKLNDTLEHVEIERAKSDSLLLNVLPMEIMKELKETGKVLPRNYPLATVLFTDIKNFTTFAEKLEPEEVIKSLNDCFLAFDDICRKYGLEKIKTLGDGYMAVGGLPVANTTNPRDAVMAGLEMQQWIGKRNADGDANPDGRWEIRIGINTGPVVAGVIGTKKFIYDLWGDTVNLASRVTDKAQADNVLVDVVTYERVKSIYEFDAPETLDVRGKGKVIAYRLLRLRASTPEYGTARALN